MKNERKLSMYIACAFSRDWQSDALEVNQTAYVVNLVAQYGIETTANIPSSSGVDLGPRNEGEPGGNEGMRSFPSAVL